ncbi:MAG: hypothetical protein AB7E52_01430 [Bdellovibrionales bacterium]
MNKKAFALLGVAVLLSGCTHYMWVKPSGDPATFNADNYACKQNSMAAAPPVFQVYDPTPVHYGPKRVITDCRDKGDHRICKTRVQPDVYAPPTAVDLNKSNRNDLYNACMGAKGWLWQAVEDPE